MIIERLSLPENLAVYAILETLSVFLIILVTGFAINLINRCITGFLSVTIGSVPAFVIRNYATYAGTVHHELSHAIVAFITGARVKKITLFPKGATLGSVELEPRGNIFFRSVQLSLSAIAPVALGTVTLFLLWSRLLPGLSEIWQFILFWYIFISILFHMTMSGADYLNFFKGLIPSAFVLFIFFLILGAFGFCF